MGFFSSKSKSKSRQEGFQRARGSAIQDIWEPARAGLEAGAEQIGEYVGLGQTPQELAAQQALEAGAEAYPGMLQSYMQPGMQALTGALGAPQAALGMGLTDIVNNPAVQAQAEAIQSRLNRNLAENVLPGIRASAATRGTLGGSGQEIREAVAGRGTQEALGSALADLYGGAYQAGLGAETARYGAGLGAATSAMGMLPGMAQLGLSQYTQPAALQQAAGQQAMAPYQRAFTGMGALQAPGAAFGERRSDEKQWTWGESESKTKSSPSGFSNLGNLLSMGGALGGAMFGGGMPSMAGLFTGGQTMAPPAYGMYNNPWTYGGYRA